jgi:hypothetical protein
MLPGVSDSRRMVLFQNWIFSIDLSIPAPDFFFTWSPTWIWLHGNGWIRFCGYFFNLIHGCALIVFEKVYIMLAHYYFKWAQESVPSCRICICSSDLPLPMLVCMIIAGLSSPCRLSLVMILGFKFLLSLYHCTISTYPSLQHKYMCSFLPGQAIRVRGLISLQ